MAQKLCGNARAWQMEIGPPLTVKHYFDPGFDSKFRDVAEWNSACVGPNQIDEIEPLDDAATTPYRNAVVVI